MAASSINDATDRAWHVTHHSALITRHSLMCGIVGYVGKPPVVQTLLDCLGRLEYRGYDSAGVAVVNGKGIEVRKCVGKIKELVASIKQHPFEGKLGIAHCLVPETLVQLADGRVMRIDSLGEEATVLALDLTARTVVSCRAKVWAHAAPRQLVELKTTFGTIRCTPQHRLFAADEEGRLLAKAAGRLRVGDLLFHACRWETSGGTNLTFQSVEAKRYYRLGNQARTRLRQEVSSVGTASVAAFAGVSAGTLSHLWERDRNASESMLRPVATYLDLAFPLPDSESIHRHHGSFVSFPQQSSPAIMQWLGYLLGDGHVGKRGVRFKDVDPDTLAEYQGISTHYFNLKGRVVPIPRINAHLLEINGLGLAEWLRVNVLERRRQLLDQIGMLPTEQLAAFLRGLFDAEGGVARQAGQVAFTMTDTELLRRVQLWLLRLGILASRYDSEANPAQRRKRPSIKLLITRQDALAAFQDAIGFSSARKRAWLEGVLASKRRGRYLSSRAISASKATILKRLKESGIPPSVLRPFREGRQFTDGQAERLVHVLQDFPQASSVAEDLRRQLRSDVRCHRVLSTKRIPAKGGMVYDLEVDGLENFFANGILSHNSRWATHGEPSEVNAHPHTDCTGRLAIVHNGIVENYAELKQKLMEKGHRFRSKTDTEVIAHLVEEHAKRLPVDEAFRAALKQLRGSYAVCLISEDDPDRLLGARCGSPLIVGVGEGEAFLASDVPAVLEHTRRVLYLNEGEVVELTAAGVKLSTLAGAAVHRKPSVVSWDLAAAQKEGFDHFMLKEINEQPMAIEKTLASRLDLEKSQIIFDRRTRGFLSKLSPQEKLVIIACGTAYHAGLVGGYMLEELVRVPVDVDLASEFRYRGPMLDRHTTVIAITQSGETADTLAGVRLAKEQGAKIISICNVMGASIPRESDAVIYTHAGPEIAVASTKAYTSQLSALYLLTLSLAKTRKSISASRWRDLARELGRVPKLVEQALATERDVKPIARAYAGARDCYYLGRRYNFPTALEGALKLKEICPQIHAEGYAAGEMKHGPISLIRKGWPVVVIATDSPVYEKVLSNIEEVRARKGECIVVASEGNRTIKRYAEHVMLVPKTEELFSPLLAAIPLQLLAYHIAKLNGCDIDQPPNLAKSVTVE